MGGLGAVLEASWAVLVSSWAVPGPSWAVLGLSCAVLGLSWAVVWPCWCRLGALPLLSTAERQRPRQPGPQRPAVGRPPKQFEARGAAACLASAGREQMEWPISRAVAATPPPPEQASQPTTHNQPSNPTSKQTSTLPIKHTSHQNGRAECAKRLNNRIPSFHTSMFLRSSCSISPPG